MKRKILLAEDEKNLQLIYREELEEEGYEVCTVSNGQEALASYREGGFSLVILDIVMPLMDGLEALSQLRRGNGKVPVILHTSYGKYFEDKRALLSDAVIMKGVDLGQLKAKIADLLE